MNSSYDKNPADNIGCGADYITCVLIGFKNIQCENRGIAVHQIIVHGLLYLFRLYNIFRCNQFVSNIALVYYV
jgi:hypothetical protein